MLYFILYKNNKNYTKITKIGTALIQIYDGTPNNLHAFVDAVNLFNDTVDSDFQAATPDRYLAAQLTVFKLVKSRLTGTARDIIAGAEDVHNIINALKRHCESQLTSDNVVAKLKGRKAERID